MPFRFAIGQRVKLRDTGELGVVEYNGTHPTLDTPFCRVRLEDGTTVTKAESALIEA
jgi:DNA-directed RNA polymerase subunit L